MDSMDIYPPPERGASLMLAFHLESKTSIIIGTNSLAAQRAFAALEAGSKVVVLGNGGKTGACNELLWRAEIGEIDLLDYNDIAGPSDAAKSHDIFGLESFMDSRAPVALVSVTDTLMTLDTASRRSMNSAMRIYNICRARNVPINVADIGELCDFSYVASHRFNDPTSGRATPLQIGVTTNGKGCRLSGRIKREVVASVSKDAGIAVQKIGKLRSLAKAKTESGTGEPESKFDRSASITSLSSNNSEGLFRRMKWVAQISEFWPLTKLANLSDDDMETLLQETHSDSNQQLAIETEVERDPLRSRHSLLIETPKHPGQILLVGSGPGHPSLLTVAAYEALTKRANLVLSDKLVPEAVLNLIPSSVEVRIAKKFPGNADNAQTELMEAAVEAAHTGKIVVRLKQGDPMVYGRAGEEVLFFRRHGFEAIVIPGLTSALSAPSFAGIPTTQRGVSESFIVCTGVGRQGKEVRLPGYQRSRTLILLMGVARLSRILTVIQEDQEDIGVTLRDGASYPPHTPIAVIERASMPDQRVIMSTLRNVSEAIESSGEQRPPGLLVIGWAVLALWGQGDVSVLDDNSAIARDLERTETWLEGKRWRLLEGLPMYWS